MFVAAIVRYVGSFYAELGGLDYLTFAGGIGENSATVRRRVCDALGVFGVKIDPEKNAKRPRRVRDFCARLQGEDLHDRHR